MRFFKPFISMMKPLKYRHQFSFIGVILVIPMIMMSFVFVIDTNRDLRLLDERLTGAHYNHLLKDLLRDVQQYRGLTISKINGDASQESERLELEKKVLHDFKAMDMFTKGSGISLPSFEMTHQLKKEWYEIALIESMDQSEMMAMQTGLITKILGTMSQVADESNLFLTQTNYTYYMVQDVVKMLPRITEDLGQARAMGMAITARGEVDDQETANLLALLVPIKQSIMELKQGKKVLAQNQSKLHVVLDQPREEVVRHTNHFIEYVQRELIETKQVKVKPKDFFNQATKTIETSFHLYELETAELSRLIEQQVGTLKKYRNIMIVLIVGALSLTLYGFFGFFFSIRNRIDELTSAGYLFFYRYLFSPQIKKVEKQYQLTERKLQKVRNELSLKVMQAQEDERKRIAGELHDGVGQLLYATLVRLTIIDNTQTELDRKEHLQQARKGISNAMKEIKGIAQSLRPGSLDDLGFIPALQSLMSEYEKTYGIQVQFYCTGHSERLPSAVETVLYRICQEALTNIAKHSQANLIYLSIDMNDEATDLKIRDNGIGFSVKAYFSQRQKKGIGLLSIEERVNAFGGSFKIISSKQGTSLFVSIPKRKIKG